MLIAALAATAMPSAPEGPVAPQRQAQATVRILPAVELKFAEIEQRRPELLRETMIRASDGSQATAKLVEFE